MSNPYHTLRVVALTPETSDAVTIHLEHPEKQHLPFIPGQFLTLLIPFEGTKVRRSYSLSSTPQDLPRLSVTVKRVTGGLVSNYLVDQVQIGQEIEVMEPIGNFCLTCDSNQTRHVVLIGAGSGITPLISILKSVLHEEPHSKVTLLYGNRHEDAVIFKRELENLAATYPERLKVEIIYSQPKQTTAQVKVEKKGFAAKLLSSLGLSKSDSAAKSNRLNHKSISKKLQELGLANQLGALYYLCGPEGLMDEAKNALTNLRVPANLIFTERFVHKKNTDANISIADNGDAITRVVTIKYNGATNQVTVNPNQTILEAGLAQNLDLPYSCQAGLCTACMGKCLQGKVRMDEHDGLSDAEVAEGYVLNCVGHPVTDDVVIEIS